MDWLIQALGVQDNGRRTPVDPVCTYVPILNIMQEKLPIKMAGGVPHYKSGGLVLYGGVGI